LPSGSDEGPDSESRQEHHGSEGPEELRAQRHCTPTDAAQSTPP
jgi:hypothetical protein